MSGFLGMEAERESNICSIDDGKEPRDSCEERQEEKREENKEETKPRGNLQTSTELRQVHFAKGAFPMLSPLKIKEERRENRREVCEENWGSENDDGDARN